MTRTYTSTTTPTKTLTPTPTLGTSACSGVPAWNGNFVPYAIGAKVTYNGELYQCIQTHTSESTWEPNVTPALWQDLGPCTAVKTAAVYPNPSTSSGTVNLAVPLTATSDVMVEVYTLNFRKVIQRTYSQAAVGTDLPLELKGDKGEKLANGLYYILAQAQGKNWTVKLLVLH